MLSNSPGEYYHVQYTMDVDPKVGLRKVHSHNVYDSLSSFSGLKNVVILG